ncbi:hypothetical protein C8R47DRAFT_1226923 [Mycena vitilis]|nr:hypothetical protein C8R47DRAFT_1226923 [Mycena vitilis]
MAPASFFTIFLLLSAVLLHVLAKLNQTAQLPGLTFNLSTPRPADTVTTLSTVPDACAKYTGGLGSECPTTMSARWVLCRCASANITLDAAVDFLAHVPIGLRRFVGTVLVMPDTTAHAYTFPTSGEIHFFGVCSQRTWIHESTHAADGALGISNGAPWIQAVGNDTCVPDTYAQTNLVEDLAQMSVVECMPHQLAYLQSLPLYNATTLFGNTCAFEPQLANARHSLAPSSSSAVRLRGPIADSASWADSISPVD